MHGNPRRSNPVYSESYQRIYDLPIDFNIIKLVHHFEENYAKLPFKCLAFIATDCERGYWTKHI